MNLYVRIIHETLLQFFNNFHCFTRDIVAEIFVDQTAELLYQTVQYAWQQNYIYPLIVCWSDIGTNTYTLYLLLFFL